jgi:DDE family transposase
MSSSYRLRNWPEYEHALEARGSIALFFPRETIRHWRAEASAARQRGHPVVYSNEAITALLMLQEHFRMGLRETVGLARSLFSVLELDLPVPTHTTLSRRRHRLPATLPIRAATLAQPVHLVVDSTGVQLVGEGSWRQHWCGGYPGLAWMRHYLRVHFGVDEATGELHALGVSTMSVTDGEMLPALLREVTAPLTQVTGDGAYDRWSCYDAVAARPEHPRAVFPPQHGRHRRARIKQHGNCRAPPLDRDEHIRRIRRVGRRRWKQEVGYHRRSLAETFASRWKRHFGDRLTARSFASQSTEVFIRGAVVNRLLWLGRPQSYRADRT